MRFHRADQLALFMAIGCLLPTNRPAAAQQPLLAPWGATRAPAAPTANPTPPVKPKAVLVRNPNEQPGAPPYALTDDRGRVQRLVEPTPGIDLSRHVGKIVRVSHDTGGTLLASQLELPDELLATTLSTPTASRVIPAQHTPPGPVGDGSATRGSTDPGPAPEPVPPEPIELDDAFTDDPRPEEVAAPAAVVDGLQFPSTLQPSGPAPVVANACRECGQPPGFRSTQRRLINTPHCPTCGESQSGFDFGFDLLLLRTQDSAAVNGGGDLEFAQRYELGYGDAWGRRVALRYFDYDTGLALGSLDLETIDLEFQRRITWGPRSEVRFGGGLRWAEYDETGGLAYSDTIGPLLSLHARAPAVGRVDGILTLRQSYQFGDASFAGAPADRGTFGVTEVQFGLEHRRHTRAGDVFARGLLETQYWDDVGRQGSLTGSRGLIGFGIGLGLVR